MKKFMFLYKGFVTPSPEIGRAWMELVQPGGRRDGRQRESHDGWHRGDAR